MTFSMSSMPRNGDNGLRYPSYDSLNSEIHLGPKSIRGDHFNYFLDREIGELFSKTNAQKEEILLLREQIADACVKELQLLNEKHAMERKFSDLRMALDEKQNDAIAAALKELVQRKGCLEDNLKLAHDLEAEEDESYIFTSSMLRLLAEYGIRPHVINASAIANSAKLLFHQLQWKIRTSHASIIDIDYRLGNEPGNSFSNKGSQPPSATESQHTQTSKVSNVFDFYPYNLNPREQQVVSTPNMPRFIQDHDLMDMKEVNYVPRFEMRHAFNSDNPREFSSTYDKEAEGPIILGSIEDTVGKTSEKAISDSLFNMPTMHEEHASSVSEGEGLLPGIEGFQIIGDAKPGSTLQACGFPVRGTSLCLFQWVRHLQDGTRHYIEGATNPDYVVTADDVNKLIAVECIPMDDSGHQGELVRIFANNHTKITCDPDMQQEIETHISAGRATFNVLLLIDSSEAWEPSTLIFKRSSYQIKINNMEVVFVEEKYSVDLSIKIPSGLSTQFVLTRANGTSHPFRTNHGVRMRDTIVLTMRNFQSKALDDKRKGKSSLSY